jgi:hypothetical protein
VLNYAQQKIYFHLTLFTLQIVAFVGILALVVQIAISTPQSYGHHRHNPSSLRAVAMATPYLSLADATTNNVNFGGVPYPLYPTYLPFFPYWQ